MTGSRYAVKGPAGVQLERCLQFENARLAAGATRSVILHRGPRAALPRPTRFPEFGWSRALWSRVHRCRGSQARRSGIGNFPRVDRTRVSSLFKPSGQNWSSFCHQARVQVCIDYVSPSAFPATICETRSSRPGFGIELKFSRAAFSRCSRPCVSRAKTTTSPHYAASRYLLEHEHRVPRIDRRRAMAAAVPAPTTIINSLRSFINKGRRRGQGSPGYGSVPGRSASNQFDAELLARQVALRHSRARAGSPFPAAGAGRSMIGKNLARAHVHWSTRGGWPDGSGSIERRGLVRLVRVEPRAISRGVASLAYSPGGPSGWPSRPLYPAQSTSVGSFRLGEAHGAVEKRRGRRLP